MGHAWPGNPGCLRISQRDFLGRLGATTAAPTTIVSVAVLFIAVSGIENSELLADCMGYLFRLRPGDRLVARNSLLLIHIRLDQARIDRKRFATYKPSRDAHCHHPLKHPPQSMALTEAFVAGSAEHRMIGNLIFDAEPAEPAIGQINLYLRAQPPLRTQCKHLPDQQHPYHQNRIN
jgi:hypothetical protein